jgi:hypothetical protein
MSIATKSFAALALASSLVACLPQTDAPDDLKTAIPTDEQVKIKLPASAGRTVGELADWYVATRDVTVMFNGGTAWVLILIHSIVQYPVTSVDGNTYTWGPWSDGPLAPTEYRLDVTDNGGEYSYELSGRNKTVATSEFETVIEGIALAGPTEETGNGSFSVDFDAGKRVNPVDGGDGRGSIQVNYDLATRHLDLGIISTDDNGNPVSADYAYNEAADRSGDMVFNILGNAGGTAMDEDITLRSRWLSTGEGRADARVSGGDLGGTEAIASECWNNLFRRTFYTDNVNFAATEGAATDCAYADADLPE